MPQEQTASKHNQNNPEQQVSTCPAGEAFPIPKPEEYEKEFKRLKKLVGEQRLKGR